MRERVSVFHLASVETDVFVIYADAISRDRMSLDNAQVAPARFFHTLF